MEIMIQNVETEIIENNEVDCNLYFPLHEAFPEVSSQPGEFGYMKEEFTFTLNAAAQGSWPTGHTGKDRESFIAPIGFIIPTIRIHNKNEQGTNNIFLYPTRDIVDDTLKLDEFVEKLKEMTGILYNSLFDDNPGLKQLNQLLRSNYHNCPWARGVHGNVESIPDPHAGSEIELDVWANLLYVGKSSEVQQSLNQWLLGVKTDYYSSWGITIGPIRRHPEFEYINTDHHFIDDVHSDVNNLIVSSSNNQGGSVGVVIGPLPAGCEVVFQTEIILEGHSKTCEVVIWELPQRIKTTSAPILISGTQQLEVRTTTQSHGSIIKSEIYYHDNTQQKTIINLFKTKTYISKTF